jgi:hypothetical protein
MSEKKILFDELGFAYLGKVQDVKVEEPKQIEEVKPIEIKEEKRKKK